MVLRGVKGGLIRAIIVGNSSPEARASFIYINNSIVSSTTSLIFLSSWSMLYF